MDHVKTNRDVWNADAENWVAPGRAHWAFEAPVWGSWRNPEAELGLLPADMSGMEAIELGCGTGYVSAWMTRRGASATGVDVSAAQLATARALAAEHGLDIAFLERNAEATGLPDASFDFAISEYGASIWCTPKAWLTEAWRLLKPRGACVFLGNHPMSLICSPLSGAPAERVLHRPYRGMWGADWTKVEIEPSGVCFNLTIQGWMEVFAEVGFAVERYQELYARPETTGVIASIPADWAKDYPVEQVWHLRKV
ncbi:MAG: methyltransferase domain-containing protein [Pseudomonadota bacterium]